MFDQPLAIAAVVSVVCCYVALRVSAAPSGRAVVGVTCSLLSLLIPALADSLSRSVGVRLGLPMAVALVAGAWLEALLDPKRRAGQRSLAVPGLFLAFIAAGVLSTWLSSGILPLQVAIIVAAWGALVKLGPTPRDVTTALTRSLVGFTYLICALLPSGLLDQSTWMSQLGSEVDTRFGLNDWLGLPGRWAGPFPHPNTLGFFAALAIVHALSLNRAPRLLLGLPAAILLVASGSYTSATAALAGSLALLILRRTRRLGWAGMALLLTGVGVAALGFAANASLTGRTSFWGIFIDRAAEKPVLGWGAQGADQLIGLGVLPGFAVNAHNWVINTLFVGGLLGLVLGIAGLVRLTQYAMRSDSAYRPAAIGLLVVLGVESLTESGLVATAPSLAWLCIMVVWGISEPLRGGVPTSTESEESSREDRAAGNSAAALR